MMRALIGPGIVVAIFGLIFLLAGLEDFRKTHRSWLFRPLDILPAAAGLGFLAMMFAVAGGAVYPPIVSTVAEPIVCPGGLDTLSRDYSYRPGQQGVTRNLLCARGGWRAARRHHSRDRRGDINLYRRRAAVFGVAVDAAPAPQHIQCRSRKARP